MARTNKYASLNFNDIYEKKIINNNNNTNSSNNSSPSPSPNLTKTKISNSRIHGNMLVLSRPTPKPISLPSQTPPPRQQTQPQKQTQQPLSPDPTRIESDSIALRPLGRTGSAIAVSHYSPLSSPRDLSVSPKPDKFVPPHLRPGYVCKEEKPVPEFYKQSPVGGKTREFRQGQFVYGEEGRPKSGGGGGYERMKRGSEMYRPGSSGSRPNSSG